MASTGAMEGWNIPSSFRYAFLLFKDESTAERNYKSLTGKKLGDKTIYVDYCGSKSKHEKHNTMPSPGLNRRFEINTHATVHRTNSW